MWARQLREAAVLRFIARVGALVHAAGLGFGHVGLVAFGALPGAAFADEDVEGDEAEEAAAGGADADADRGAEGQGGFLVGGEGVAEGEDCRVDCAG